MKKALLINPYWSTMGGGEEHLLSIAITLSKSGYQVEIPTSDSDLLTKARDKFNLEIDKNILLISELQNLNIFLRTKKLLEYEIVIYYTDGSYFFSPAENNFIFALVPQKSLYPHSILSKLKTRNWRYIANSEFSARFIRQYTNQSCDVLFSPIAKNYLEFAKYKKQKYILSVGRFFPHLHSKRQDVAINAFLKLSNETAKEFSLVLVGGLMQADEEYFHHLNNLAQGDKRIIFCPNATHEELCDWYKKSLIYWHCAGYGVDEKLHPENTEHFGISVLEAMGSGCATLVYDNGGPADIINTYGGGFTYKDENELLQKTTALLSNPRLLQEITQKSNEVVKNHFSKEVFDEKIRSIFNLR